MSQRAKRHYVATLSCAPLRLTVIGRSVSRGRPLLAWAAGMTCLAQCPAGVSSWGQEPRHVDRSRLDSERGVGLNAPLATVFIHIICIFAVQPLSASSCGRHSPRAYPASKHVAVRLVITVHYCACASLMRASRSPLLYTHLSIPRHDSS